MAEKLRRMQLGYSHTFYRHFNVLHATSPELLEQAYRLRWQVYCAEQSFENPIALPHGIETDEYDHHSVHAVLVHRASNHVCGCVRLILPTADGRLPVLNIIDTATRARLLSGSQMHMAEVSRYAISKTFRRRITDGEHGDIMHVGVPNGSECRMVPHMTLGLMIGVARLSVVHGVEYLCTLMTPALNRILKHIGMEFHAIGPLVEHHGFRQPCIGKVTDLLNGIQVHKPEYFDLISSEFVNRNVIHSVRKYPQLVNEKLLA